MKTRLLILLLIITLSPCYAADNRKAAIEYNNIGFSLYEQGLLAESLYYFRASFQLDPDYIYPHYNYACVLSLLMAEDVQRWSELMPDLSYHLLSSLRLNPQYKYKVLSDDDLSWFWNNMNIYQDLADLALYEPGTDPESLAEQLISRNWMTRTTEGSPVGDLSFFRGGRVEWAIGNTRTSGRYSITGNIVFIQFDENITLLRGRSFNRLTLLLPDPYVSFRFLEVPDTFHSINKR